MRVFIPPNYLKKVVYLSYLCKLISVCHQRLFISSFPLLLKRDLMVGQEVLTVVQMLLFDNVLLSVK